jgi:hypothetical protein
MIYNAILAFPKFFRPMLAAVPYIGTVLAFLPEIVGFIKTISGMLDRGVTEIEIKNRIKAVDKAFANPDRIESAKELRDALTFK